MKVERGALTVGHIQGAPVRLHWSLLVVPLVFGRLQWLPTFWLAMTLLVLLHELGHWAMIRRFGFPVREIMVHGMGGHCAWQGRASPLQRAWIASGGILAQGGVLLLALGLSSANLLSWELQQALIWSNLWIMGFNLLPFPPLDGVEALKLPGLLWAQRHRRPPPPKKRLPPEEPTPMEPEPLGEVPPEVVATVDALLEEVGIRKGPRPDR